MSALIFLGGSCTYTEKLREHTGKSKYVIAVDRGYEHCLKMGIRADYLLGDMDSISERALEKAKTDPKLNIIKYQPKKNFTDSELAIEKALELGCKEIIFAGAFGSRLDHMLANQMTVATLALKGIRCCLTDGINFMYTVTKETSPFIIKNQDEKRNIRVYNGPLKLVDEGVGEEEKKVPGHDDKKEYISLISLIEDIERVDISGLSYPARNLPLPLGSQRAVSNQRGPVEETEDRPVSFLDDKIDLDVLMKRDYPSLFEIWVKTNL